MADLGLTFTADTKGLKQASGGLDGVTDSAKKVDSAIAKMDSTLKKTDKEFSATTVTIEEFAEALSLDESDFDSAQKSIINNLNRTSANLEMATLAVNRFEQDQKTTGMTITATGKVVDKQGVEVIKLTRRWADLQTRLGKSRKVFEGAQVSARRLTESVKAGGKGFKLAGNSAQMLGWQLQDVAVQAQMGISPFTILGQQGSQLASVLGSKGALLGAVIAIGSALGGVLWKALGETAENAEELSERIDGVTQSFEDLLKAQAMFKVQEGKSAIKLLGNEAEETRNTVKGLAIELRQLEKKREKTHELIEAGVLLSKKQLSNNAKNNKLISDVNKKLTTSKAKHETITQEIKHQEEEIKKLSGLAVLATDKWKDSALEALSLTGGAEDKRWIAINKGRREYKAQLDLIREIENTTNSLLTIEMRSKDAAIKKGRAQQEVLKNQRLAATESQLVSLADFGKSESTLEKERYTESLEMLRTYAEEKGWLDTKLKETELLLEAQHQQNITALEKDGQKERAQNQMGLLEGLNVAANIHSNITTALYAKEKAQLQNDLANKHKFSAAEIALKEKQAKQIFENQKDADLNGIVTATALQASQNLNNPVAFAGILAAGAAQWATANATQYGGSSSAPTAGALPPSQNTTNNNSGGNTNTFNFNGIPTGEGLEMLRQAFSDGDVMFDANSAQAQALQS